MRAWTGGAVHRRYGALWRAGACLTALAAAGARAAVTPTSGLRVAFEERFDDGDTTGLPLGAGPLGGASQLMSKLSATGRLGLEGRTFVLEGAYAPSLMLRHGSGSASLDHQLQLDFSKRLDPRLRLELGVQGWRVSDPTSLPRLGLARIDEPVLYGRADARGRWDVARRWRLTAGYRFEAARLVGTGPLLADVPRAPGFVHVPWVTLEHVLTRRARVGVEYRHQAFLFGADSAQAHHVGLRWGYRLSRTFNLQAQGGPTWFTATRAGTQAGVMPRLALDLTEERRQLSWGVSVGHDLMGASGFDTARWATYGAAMFGWSFQRDLRLNLAANYFRNGLPPNQGVLPWAVGGARVDQGYTVGAGVEWRLAPSLGLHGTVTRIDQLAAEGATVGTSMARNIASVRAVWTAWE